MARGLSFRLFEAADVPALLALWERDAGWGSLSPDAWRRLHVDTPCGECIVAVAVDGRGEIAAQEVFTPCRVFIGDGEVPAVQLAAPILRRYLREGPLARPDHPVIGLFRVGAAEAARRGYRLAVALPRRAWLPFFSWGARVGLPRFVCADYPCVAAPLAPPPPTVDAAGLLASPLTRFAAQHEGLFQSARATLPATCGIVRTVEWLQWRSGGNTVVEVRSSRGGMLVGYTAVRNRDGLLVDVLAARYGDLAGVLGASLA